MPQHSIWLHCCFLAWPSPITSDVYLTLCTSECCLQHTHTKQHSGLTYLVICLDPAQADCLCARAQAPARCCSPGPASPARAFPKATPTKTIPDRGTLAEEGTLAEGGTLAAARLRPHLLLRVGALHLLPPQGAPRPHPPPPPAAAYATSTTQTWSVRLAP